MTFDPIICSQQDLEDTWRTLMTPLGFSRRSIWLMLLDGDDHPLPQLIEVDDVDAPPTAEARAGFATSVARLREELVPGGRVAFLRSRPGGGGLTAEDREWAEALYEVGRLAGVPTEVVHRACDTDLVPVPMDEVPAPT